MERNGSLESRKCSKLYASNNKSIKSVVKLPYILECVSTRRLVLKCDARLIYTYDRGSCHSFITYGRGRWSVCVFSWDVLDRNRQISDKLLPPFVLCPTFGLDMQTMCPSLLIKNETKKRQWVSKAGSGPAATVCPLASFLSLPY